MSEVLQQDLVDEISFLELALSSSKCQIGTLTKLRDKAEQLSVRLCFSSAS